MSSNSLELKIDIYSTVYSVSFMEDLRKWIVSLLHYFKKRKAVKCLRIVFVTPSVIYHNIVSRQIFKKEIYLIPLILVYNTLRMKNNTVAYLCHWFSQIYVIKKFNLLESFVKECHYFILVIIRNIYFIFCWIFYL